MLALDAFFFNFAINQATPYGPINPPGVFTLSGVPSDFFGNPTWGINVRRAFAHCFDYDTFKQTAYNGEAVQPATAIISGLPYYDPGIPKNTYNLTQATLDFKAVPGLWQMGFSINIVYNKDNDAAKTATSLLETAVESLNPLFKVTSVSVAWTDFQNYVKHGQLPLFIGSWSAGYSDPHGFAFPFYDSKGALAHAQGYSNATIDALVEMGIRTPEGNDRSAIYDLIQAIAVEDCPNVPIAQPLGRHYERDWCVDWYYNQLYSGSFTSSLESTSPGSHGIYFYNLWKAYYIPHAFYNDTYPNYTTSHILPYDINYDGKIDMKDISYVAHAFGAEFGPPINSRWLFRADVNNDRRINMRDVGTVAFHFGKHYP